VLDEVEQRAEWMAEKTGLPLWAVWALLAVAVLLVLLPCIWVSLELAGSKFVLRARWHSTGKLPRPRPWEARLRPDTRWRQWSYGAWTQTELTHMSGRIPRVRKAPPLLMPLPSPPLGSMVHFTRAACSLHALPAGVLMIFGSRRRCPPRQPPSVVTTHGEPDRPEHARCAKRPTLRPSP
jgi:hypothetical protein